MVQSLLTAWINFYLSKKGNDMSVMDAPQPSAEVSVEAKKTVFADMYVRHRQNIGELTRAIN